MAWKTVLLLVLALVILLVALRLYGSSRWDAGTRRLRERIEAARIPIEPGTDQVAELAGLPAPVQRYFRTALTEGQPMVAAVRLEHAGTFNMSATAEQWKPFTSSQRVVTRRPGFDWDARVAMMPGLPVRVHDAYAAGEGVLHAAVLGLVTVADLRGTGEVAKGELMRFFAESAWYPTALLPSQGVRWEAVDDRSARATLKDGDLALTLLFRFNGDGLIDTVRAESRGRTVGNKVIPTPWEGRFWDYEVHDGMRVPMEGEVSWLLPEGPKPYWRGRITRISYEFAR
jgi:hypothetical protein